MSQSAHFTKLDNSAQSGSPPHIVEFSWDTWNFSIHYLRYQPNLSRKLRPWIQSIADRSSQSTASSWLRIAFNWPILSAPTKAWLLSAGATGNLQPTAMAPGAGGAPPSGATTDDPLVWIDCEMTGLNPDTEEIIEIYCIITTGNLEIIDQGGYHAVIHCPASRLDQMDEWCTQTHGNSGLTAAVLASSTTPEQAAGGLYNYITSFIPEKRKALLAGNSVHADRAFLRREPYAKVIDHLHYRILDISAIKEAGRRWCSREIMAQAPAKKGRHLARDDILESIEEARYYRQAIFQRVS